jgi:prophage tail gpP-like protein
MSNLALVVNGRRYAGWKSVRVTRSIESLAGAFDLEVSDRWGGQDVPWPIREEDACRVEIDGAVVIDGYIDRRSLSFSATQRSLLYAGRDRAAALVDSSAILDKWTFRNASVLEVARKVAEPFGVAVSLQAGLVLPKPPRKLVVNPGDSAFDAIRRAAAAAGVLAVSDGAGGILIARAGRTRAATSLVEGQNVLSASVDYDGQQRFARYVVATQIPGTDAAAGPATRIRAEARDEAIRRTDRILLIQPEAGVTTDYARQRADWEARIRAATAETVTVVVVGWKQSRGRLWPLNALVNVRVPAIGVGGDMLIAEVEHSISEGGEVTKLQLVRPDAFTPEPEAVVKQSSGGLWKIDGSPETGSIPSALDAFGNR